MKKLALGLLISFVLGGGFGCNGGSAGAIAQTGTSDQARTTSLTSADLAGQMVTSAVQTTLGGLKLGNLKTEILHGTGKNDTTLTLTDTVCTAGNFPTVTGTAKSNQTLSGDTAGGSGSCVWSSDATDGVQVDFNCTDPHIIVPIAFESQTQNLTMDGHVGADIVSTGNSFIMNISSKNLTAQWGASNPTCSMTYHYSVTITGDSGQFSTADGCIAACGYNFAVTNQ
jgi:hypothetical protein